MIPKKEILLSKHILIECDKENFIEATLLYSYCIKLHKKVSLYSKDMIDKQYSFLTWYDKVRFNRPSSVDFIIKVDYKIVDLYIFFKENEIKLNTKMATAFYAAFLKEYKQFIDPRCDGTIFAILSELLELGADSKICIDELLYKKSLAVLRLEAIIYTKLLLKRNAELAYVCLSQADFDATGALWNDVKGIAQELLKLAHVKEVYIIKDDDKEKIINLIKEV